MIPAIEAVILDHHSLGGSSGAHISVLMHHHPVPCVLTIQVSSVAFFLITTPLADPRWQGWFKMTNQNAHGVEIHFNALFKYAVMSLVDDFKFK